MDILCLSIHKLQVITMETVMVIEILKTGEYTKSYYEDNWRICLGRQSSKVIR